MWNDQKDILRAFNAWNVEYLVVGGHAVSEYSQPRATKDLDIFIRSSPENAQRVFSALAEYGAPLAALSPADFQKAGECFQIGVEPMRIDILQSIDGVSFDDAWMRRRSSVITSDIIPTHFISRQDLVANKLASGRLRDLADVEALTETILLSDKLEDQNG